MWEKEFDGGDGVGRVEEGGGGTSVVFECL